MTNIAGSRGIENPNNEEIPPKEFLKGVDIGNGANVLLKTLLAIDRDKTA